MNIKMLVAISGNVTLNAGDVTDKFTDAECKRLIESGAAVAVAVAAPVKRKAASLDG